MDGKAVFEQDRIAASGRQRYGPRVEIRIVVHIRYRKRDIVLRHGLVDRILRHRAVDHLDHRRVVDRRHRDVHGEHAVGIPAGIMDRILERIWQVAVLFRRIVDRLSARRDLRRAVARAVRNSGDRELFRGRRIVRIVVFQNEKIRFDVLGHRAVVVAVCRNVVDGGHRYRECIISGSAVGILHGERDLRRPELVRGGHGLDRPFGAGPACRVGHGDVRNREQRRVAACDENLKGVVVVLFVRYRERQFSRPVGRVLVDRRHARNIRNGRFIVDRRDRDGHARAGGLAGRILHRIGESALIVRFVRAVGVRRKDELLPALRHRAVPGVRLRKARDGQRVAFVLRIHVVVVQHVDRLCGVFVRRGGIVLRHGHIVDGIYGQLERIGVRKVPGILHRNGDLRGAGLVRFRRDRERAVPACVRRHGERRQQRAVIMRHRYRQRVRRVLDVANRERHRADRDVLVRRQVRKRLFLDHGRVVDRINDDGHLESRFKAAAVVRRVVEFLRSVPVRIRRIEDALVRFGRNGRAMFGIVHQRDRHVLERRVGDFVDIVVVRHGDRHGRVLVGRRFIVAAGWRVVVGGNRNRDRTRIGSPAVVRNGVGERIVPVPVLARRIQDAVLRDRRRAVGRRADRGDRQYVAVHKVRIGVVCQRGNRNRKIFIRGDCIVYGNRRVVDRRHRDGDHADAPVVGRLPVVRAHHKAVRPDVILGRRIEIGAVCVYRHRAVGRVGDGRIGQFVAFRIGGRHARRERMILRRYPGQFAECGRIVHGVDDDVVDDRLRERAVAHLEQHRHGAVLVLLGRHRNRLIPELVGREQNAGVLEDGRRLRVDRDDQVLRCGFRVVHDEVERSDGILVHLPLVRRARMLRDRRRIVDRRNGDAHRGRGRTAVPVGSRVFKGVRAVVIQRRRILHIGVHIRRSAVLACRHALDAERILFYVRIVGQHRNRNGLVLADGDLVVLHPRRVVCRVDGHRHVGAVRRAVVVDCGIGKRDRAAVIAVGRDRHIAAAAVDDLAAAYVGDRRDFKEGVLHVRVVGDHVERHAGFPRLRAGGFVHRSRVVVGDRRIVDGNDMEPELRARGERPVACDNGDQRGAEFVFLGRERDLHLLARNVGDRDILVLDEGLVIRGDRVARGIREVVVDIVHRQRHVDGRILGRGLIVVQIVDLRLVVDRRDRNRGGLPAAQPGRRLILNGIVEFVGTVVILRRRIADGSVRKHGCGSVRRPVAFRDRQGDIVPVDLAVRKKDRKVDRHVLIDRRTHRLQHRRVVHRLDREVQRPLHRGHSVADADDKIGRPVYVLAGVHRHRGARRRAGDGVTDGERNGRFGLRVPHGRVEVQRTGRAVRVVERHVERGSGGILHAGGRRRSIVDHRRIIDRVYRKPDRTRIRLAAAFLRNGVLNRGVPVCVGRRRKAYGIVIHRLQRAERRRRIDREIIRHAVGIADRKIKRKRVGVLIAGHRTSVGIKGAAEHNADVHLRGIVEALLRYRIAVGNLVGKRIRAVAVGRDRGSYIGNGLFVQTDDGRAIFRINRDRVDEQLVAVGVGIVAQHTDYRGRADEVRQRLPVIPGVRRVVDGADVDRHRRACVRAAVRNLIRKGFRAVPVRVRLVGIRAAAPRQRAVGRRGDRVDPDVVAVRVAVLRTLAGNGIERYGGILAAGYHVADRDRRVVLRNHSERKRGAVRIIRAVGHGYGHGNGPVSIGRGREGKRIGAVPVVGHRNVARVLRQQRRIAGLDADGRRIVIVLVRNAETDAADRVVLFHILVADRAHHRRMRHAVDIEIHCGGVEILAVGYGVGKLRVMVDLAVRGIVRERLRLVVEDQRAAQALGILGDRQRVAVDIVVVRQHAERPPARERHVDIVVLRHRRVRRRIDLQREGGRRGGSAVADRDPHRRRSVRVRRRRNGQRAGPVPVICNRDAVRGNQVHIAAAARHIQVRRGGFLIADVDHDAGGRGVFVRFIRGIFHRDRRRVVDGIRRERAGRLRGYGPVRNLIGKACLAVVICGGHILQRIVVGLRERAHARGGADSRKLDRVAVRVGVVFEQVGDGNRHDRRILVVLDLVVLRCGRVVRVLDVHQDRLLHGNEPVAEREGDRYVAELIRLRRKQKRNGRVVVAKAGDRNAAAADQRLVQGRRLQHETVGRRFHIVDRKRDFRVDAVLADGVFRVQPLVPRIIRDRGDVHGHGTGARKLSGILHHVGEAVRPAVIRVRRIPDLPLIDHRRAVLPVCNRQDRERLARDHADVHVRIVFQHVDKDVFILVHRCRVVHRNGRVVDVFNRNIHGCGRCSAVSVGYRIGKLVRAGIIRCRRILDLPHHDIGRAVRRRPDFRNGQRVSVRSVRIVQQHVDLDARVLGRGDVRIVRRLRRVVDGTHGDAERCADRFIVRVRYGYRDGRRSAVSIQNRLNIQAGRFVGLVDGDRSDQLRQRGFGLDRQLA